MAVNSASGQGRPASPEGPDRGALKLLVVDDDATQRTVIGQAARQAGHVVTFASSCAEAIRAIQDHQFDCVTVDLMLEDGEGTLILKAMADARFAGAVIVISGMESRRRLDARTYARSLGIDLQSLPKPVDLAALRVCLANLAKTAMGLPVVHTWGGVAAERVAELHRP